jgi:hypothetical protein
MEAGMSTSAEWQSRHDLIPSDAVEGTPVRRPDGEKLGIIDRVMIDKTTGHVAYAVLSYDGFLGLGEKHFPVPWGDLKYSTELSAYELDVPADALHRVGLRQNFDWGERERWPKLRPYHKAPYA